MTTSARQVGAWTTPELPRPFACWKATTAALVFGPNIPSTVSLAPCAFSRYCKERTVTFGQALLLPCRSSGQPWLVTAAAGGAAATAFTLVAAAAGGAARPATPTTRAAARVTEPRAGGSLPVTDDHVISGFSLIREPDVASRDPPQRRPGDACPAT